MGYIKLKFKLGLGGWKEGRKELGSWTWWVSNICCAKPLMSGILLL